jgi:26S proteasome regulatory subunit N6
MSDLAAQVKAALVLAETDVNGGVEALKALVLDASCNDVEAIKEKESAISKVIDLLVKSKNATGLSQLLSQLPAFFSAIPKAKTAKIVRSVIDAIAKIPGTTQLQVGTTRMRAALAGACGYSGSRDMPHMWCAQTDVCKEQMEWAKTEKRTFLRQRIELRLASLYLETKSYQDSLAIIGA